MDDLKLSSMAALQNLGAGGRPALSSLAASAANASDAGSKSDLRKAAEGFEAILLDHFLKAARSASLGEDILGGNGVRQTRDMYEGELARLAATRSRLGIADAIERQFAPQGASPPSGAQEHSP